MIDKEKAKTIVEGVPDIAIFAGAAVAAVLIFVMGVKCGGGKSEDASIEMNTTQVIPEGDFDSEGNTNTNTTMGPGDNA